ncbi:MAG: DNA gyrase/topoisomerase IV subunit A [Bacteroidetes bacterium]|nr:DNA gyrase/topoisomerase IV subunit A [Bacteroidota bacterium]
MEELEDIAGRTEGSEVQPEGEDLPKTVHLGGLYENWFLDYASYVILERAVPDVYDGLKPVQRRILHAMKELDDGRYNKVANIIGHTMKYHPHGDASINDALVQLGQKELLIDAQGNWGNVLTGDSAAAARYIEARLSKFAGEVLFNPKTTVWKSSYDGRNNEPVHLPAKFPLLLAQGVEGIAVGLSSRILPHNFNEIVDASIHILQQEDFEILPDFPTGGLADFSKYNNGARGGRVRIRARISQKDKKTLVITEIPFGTNTTSLIESIIDANDKGKIRIRKIDDNTAEQVEILVHLAPNVSPDQTIDALYAFTMCEVSISPNACVIWDGKPRFLDVKEILRISNKNTVEILRRELEIRKEELLEQLFFAGLEKIFIEKRIYRDIENCTTWEAVLETIDKKLQLHFKKFYRPVTTDDIVKLTEIKIKRISKFNSFKADEVMDALQVELDEVKTHLENLIDYAINYFRHIKKKYGTGRERKTEIRNFDVIEAAKVAAATSKLYVNREEGFAGTSLKKEEYVCECSDIDDIIVFRENGTFIVTRVADKLFVGEHIVHIDVFKKNDERTIYNIAYQDGKKGFVYVKRFSVKNIMRDKDYDATQGKPGSRIMYLTANPNGEAEMVKVFLRPRPKLKKLSFEFDFSQLSIKGRSSIGNILSRKPVRRIEKREEGVSTLGALDIWYDDTVRRLNRDQRGLYLGAFLGDDRIVTVMQSGEYKFTTYDLSTHFDEDMLLIRKYDPNDIITAVYIEGESQQPYIKRFQVEPSNKKVNFIGEDSQAKLMKVTFDPAPQLTIVFEENPRRKVNTEVVSLAEFITVKGYKAKGKRLTVYPYKELNLLEPVTEQQIIVVEEVDIKDEEAEEIPEIMEVAEAVLDVIEENDTHKSEIDVGREMKDEELKMKDEEVEVAEADMPERQIEAGDKGSRKNESKRDDVNLQMELDF